MGRGRAEWDQGAVSRVGSAGWDIPRGEAVAHDAGPDDHHQQQRRPERLDGRTSTEGGSQAQPGPLVGVTFQVGSSRHCASAGASHVSAASVRV